MTTGRSFEYLASFVNELPKIPDALLLNGYLTETFKCLCPATRNP